MQRSSQEAGSHAASAWIRDHEHDYAAIVARARKLEATRVVVRTVVMGNGCTHTTYDYPTVLVPRPYVPYAVDYRASYACVFALVASLGAQGKHGLVFA